MKPLSFPKKERLKSNKAIEAIFYHGNSVFSFPIMAKFTLVTKTSNLEPLQSVFVVPKRRIKKAAHRNKIRRRIKEAFRLNKEVLKNWADLNNTNVSLALVFVSSEMLTFQIIEDSVKKIIEQIIQGEEK